MRRIERECDPPVKKMLIQTDNAFVPVLTRSGPRSGKSRQVIEKWCFR